MRLYSDNVFLININVFDNYDYDIRVKKIESYWYRKLNDRPHLQKYRRLNLEIFFALLFINIFKLNIKFFGR